MRIISLYLSAAVLAAFSVPTAASAQIEFIPVVSGLSSPLFVGHAGDNLNRLFIVEQPGVIKVLQPGAAEPTTFLDIRTKILAGGERGLLGLAFHPQYVSNGRFFVFYTRAGDGALVIAEYAASPPSSNTASTSEEVLLTIPHPGFSNHNGGMLAFGPDGLLYAGVGDGGGANDPNNNAQNLDTLLGKILRIDVNAGTTYTAPADNPFVGPIPELDEIFAYGMRNPWRFSVHDPSMAIRSLQLAVLEAPHLIQQRPVWLTSARFPAARDPAGMLRAQDAPNPRPERGVGRKILGAAVGAVGGLYAGGYLGATIEGDRCHCDDPGLMGALIGAPVGAVAGGILGWRYLF